MKATWKFVFQEKIDVWSMAYFPRLLTSLYGKSVPLMLMTGLLCQLHGVLLHDTLREPDSTVVSFMIAFSKLKALSRQGIFLIP